MKWFYAQNGTGLVVEAVAAGPDGWLWRELIGKGWSREAMVLRYGGDMVTLPKCWTFAV